MNINFTPVNVTRGRKFRGFCYLVDGSYDYTRGYRNSGVDPYQCVTYVRVWDPVGKKYFYVNEDFPVEAETDPAKVAEDLAVYVKSIIDETYAWCRSKSATDADARRFARACLIKKHPEIREEIDKAFPDERDVVAEIEKTLTWASNLKSRPCMMYGHNCPGGKPYSDFKKLRMALASLENKGVTKLEGFAEAWDLLVVNSGMKVPDDVKNKVMSLQSK